MLPGLGFRHYTCVSCLSSVEELCWWVYCRREMSAYNLKYADVGRLQQRFELYDAEAQSLLSQNLAIPA